MSPKKKSDIKWRRSFQCAIQCHEIDAYFSFTNQIWKIKENTLSDSCFMIKFKKNFKKFNFNTKPNAWTIRFNEIYEYFLCVTPKTVFFSCGCKYHIFIDFHLMYCWHILANKHHDMPDTNYDTFNLVVSTLFLNKWYLKKSTFFENDPYAIITYITSCVHTFVLFFSQTNNWCDQCYLYKLLKQWRLRIEYIKKVFLFTQWIIFL